MNRTKVSVIMSVYNDAHVLEKTIQSVLSQTMIDFEFIIVNDGSSDQSQQILEAASNGDDRIVVIEQENQGLTKALINACEIAQGEFIARQDNGDVSVSNRLENQLSYLEKNAKTVMLSCGTRFVGPLEETLYTVIQSKEEATNGLKQSSVETLKGPPHHGSVMFRRQTYEQVGGYRAEFKVAQDIDLWTRLIEHGDHFCLPDVLYQACVAKNSISMLRREQQLLATQVIIDCSHARSVHGNDKKILDSFLNKSSDTKKSVLTSEKTDASYYYFLASNLFKTDLKACLHYLRLTLKNNPYHIKAYIKYFMSIAREISNGILKQ